MVDVVYVCGLPGVGKNTVLKELESILRAEGCQRNFRVVGFGDEMLSVVNEDVGIIERHGRVGRDEIREKLSYEEQKACIFRTMSRLIRKYDELDLLFLHGHSVLETPYGYLSGFPTVLYQTMRDLFFEHSFNLAMLVHITAKPEEIKRRREADRHRRRRPEAVEVIERYLRLTEMAMYSIALNLYIPLVIIENKEGRVRDAAEELYAALKKRGIA